MAWYDYGIRGRDDHFMFVSGGITQPISGYVNLSGYVGVGSFSLNPSPTAGEVTRTLLTTTTKGTQIYVEKRATLNNNVQFYTPTELKNQWDYGCRIVWKRENNESSGGQGYSSGWFSKFIAGDGSIYDHNFRKEPDGFKWAYATQAMPKSGASGGTTNQVAMVKTSRGLEFYAVGFPWPKNPTQYPCPASLIGYIPTEILNNEYWFDPETDAISESEYKQGISGSSEAPDRTVDYDYTGNDIDFPSLPSGASALGFGKMSIFHPSDSQLANALSIIWSMQDISSITDLFDLIKDSLLKIIYKPEQYCVSLMLMPLSVSGTNKTIYFGRYNTEVSAPAIASQWQTVDCGSVSVPLRSGTAFDYSPHVKAMIFLPYVGFRAINVNEIMGGTVYVKYYVDMFTGSALCFVKIANDLCNSSVLYTYECNVAQQVPITSSNYSGIIGSLITTSSQVIAGNMAGAAASAAGMIQSVSPDVQTSGQLNANTGALGHNKPYVVLHFPVQSVSAGFVNQNGYPSSVNVMLGNIKGYTEVEKVHLNIPNAYREDLEEIERLLNEGVVL